MKSVKKIIKDKLNKLPYIRELYKQKELFVKNSCYPPGHYYSPIVSVEEIKAQESKIWHYKSKINGIKLNTKSQIELIRSFKRYYAEIPFEKDKKDGLRYYFNNEMFLYTDGFILYSMMRYLKPSKIIEVGSGFSSALMLDVNQLYFNNSIELNFIEPFADRLYSNITEADKNNTTIIEKNVQDVDLIFFEKLNKGDILFIDSTHVSKTGSDVNFIFFEILPRLNSGVFIHFHDVFFPFEYPKGWVYGGRNWNENYILRAFLMNNNEFEIKLFPHFLHLNHAEVYKDYPMTYKNKGGSIWLEKMC